MDVRKRGIEVFQELVGNLFPGAFCVVTKDPDREDIGLVLHTDSAGTKPIVSYLLWKESGDASAFRGIAQDVLAMNLDDLICVGATPLSFVDYVAINGFRVPKEQVLKMLSEGFEDVMRNLRELGLRVIFAGGETADLPDLVRTLDVSATSLGRVALKKAVTGERINPGNMIVGVRSGGKTPQDRRENSGIMCNGLTLARRCLLEREYGRSFPEACEAQGEGYGGRFSLDDEPDGLSMTVGEALSSPTRVFAPHVLRVLGSSAPQITGLIHNTGGGLTKCLKLGRGIHYVKDDLYEPDPIFKLIKAESNEDWRSMCEAFNMGVGFEVLCEPEAADDVVDRFCSMGTMAKVIGRTLSSAKETNCLTIRGSFGQFKYSA